MSRFLWCLIFVLSIGASASARMVEPLRSGDWRGGAFLSNKTGKLTSCIATASYKSGIVVSIGILRNRAFILGFSKKGWRYSPGTFVVKGKIDFNDWTRLTARTLSSRRGFTLLLNAKTRRILRAGRVLRIQIGQRTYSFRLTGTANLIDLLNNCVTRQLTVEASSRNTGRIKNGIARRDPVGGKRVATAPVTRNKTVGANRPPARKKSKKSTGTGFFVSREGHLVTNRHVVAGCRSIRVGYPNGVFQSASLIATGRQDDLAVLKTSLAPRAIASFRGGSRPQLGESVVIFGFPYFGVLAKSGNLATGNISALAGLANETSQYQVSAPMQPGNSGGPVLGTSGNVIAVAQSKLNAVKIAKATGDIPQNINFAIKGSVVLEFLESQDVRFMTRVVGAPLQVSEIASRAKQFTVIVKCNN